jgi:hypothetical protein
MHVIAGDIVGEQRCPDQQDGLTQPSSIAVSILPKPEQERAIVAAMSQMIDVARLDVTISSWHEQRLTNSPSLDKAAKTTSKSDP